MDLSFDRLYYSRECPRVCGETEGHELENENTVIYYKSKEHFEKPMDWEVN